MSPNNNNNNNSINGRAQEFRPDSTADIDNRDSEAWMYSFGAAMIPFTAFCYGHSLGMTARVVEGVARSPVGVYGLLALPFCTLAMEKSIYDTVQAWQGINPNVRPKDRGGFPSGGANLPSFSLIPIQNRHRELVKRFTSQTGSTTS
eukprot:CAMPEP_0198121986 /NCGR_PEP_ID=MMETSP1442-20131203/33631_1 /TAXON_ID= /ORGANISM="Craspedostauros australis, Strain CCMP3328" /LENGTH=146 /DNA_ID=CAMNT_0043780907 /DNA_START=172 /DNA_END=612 /DNA_ORIENTATION=-